MANNDIGAFQGIPLRAYLFIIYADPIQNSYIEITKDFHDNIVRSNTYIRNGSMETWWGNSILNTLKQEDNDEFLMNKRSYIRETLGRTLFSADASAEYLSDEDTECKLNTFYNAATAGNIFINWGKVSILTNNIIGKTRGII